jgi:hypothetical protein
MRLASLGAVSWILFSGSGQWQPVLCRCERVRALERIARLVNLEGATAAMLSTGGTKVAGFLFTFQRNWCRRFVLRFATDASCKI